MIKSAPDLMALAKMYDQRDHLELIVSYASDNLYKWPEGKQPW
jgi:hypothetical protein